MINLFDILWIDRLLEKLERLTGFALDGWKLVKIPEEKKPSVVINYSDRIGDTETIEITSFRNAAQAVVLALIGTADALSVGYDDLPELAIIEAALAAEDGFSYTIENECAAITILARYNP